ncbi:MAG: PVC-type heme-binding CxxCH protein [Verrucomicrobiales bacterium]
MRFFLFSALCALASSCFLSADSFPEIHNSEAGEPIPPAEALKKLRLPEGFHATLFAAEPDIQNPIAASWDHRGRLWVAENYTYAESSKRFDLSMNDRVVILEDQDHDGHAETRKVFLDQVQMLTGLTKTPQGLYLMCPPQLLFIPDRNQDDLPDGPPEVLLDGFEVAQSNYHNLANGLRFGPDGWLYGRCGHSCPAQIGRPGTPAAERLPMIGGIWRYHPGTQRAEVLCHGTVNPWGHDWDENGQLFFSNTVIGHLWHAIPGAHFKESSGGPRHPHLYERLDMIADHYHYDRNGTWQESRAGAADDFGGGHSHIGGLIYQGDNWPAKYRGHYLTLNQHGRRINVEKLQRQRTGYLATHEPDLIFSDDPWFVGLDLLTGPDGSVLLLDWSDTGECHDHSGVHRQSGRIYKISYGKPEKPGLPSLADPAAFQKLITHPNSWHYDQVRHLLRGRELSASQLGSLHPLAFSQNTPTPHRLRALNLLHAHGQLPQTETLTLLAEENEHLRSFALRSLLDYSPLDTIHGRILATQALPDETFAKLRELAASDPSGLVHLTLASSLQRLAPAQRLPLAEVLLTRSPHATDPTLLHLVWLGLINAHHESPRALFPLLAQAPGTSLTRWAARFCASAYPAQKQALNELLATSFGESQRREILHGLAQAFTGRSELAAPENWPTFAQAFQKRPPSREFLQLELLFGSPATLDRLQKTARDPAAPLAERQNALRLLIDTKAPRIAPLCEKLLATPELNALALRGLALRSDPGTAATIISHFKFFRPEDHAQVTEILASRPAWAHQLLDAIAQGHIPPRALPVHTARRIAELKDEKLSAKLTRHWGQLNSSNAQREQQIKKLRQKLTPDTLAQADLSAGRALYQQSCAACHRFFGAGGELGPDLTGSGRQNLDYLLHNIIDPNAAVGKDYQLVTFTLKDGRHLAGSIAKESPDSLTLRLPGQEIVLAKSDITSQQSLPNSLMPEGLLDPLTEQEIRDLIAYLMSRSQVPLPAK